MHRQSERIFININKHEKDNLEKLTRPFWTIDDGLSPFHYFW